MDRRTFLKISTALGATVAAPTPARAEGPSAQHVTYPLTASRAEAEDLLETLAQQLGPVVARSLRVVRLDGRFVALYDRSDVRDPTSVAAARAVAEAHDDILRRVFDEQGVFATVVSQSALEDVHNVRYALKAAPADAASADALLAAHAAVARMLGPGVAKALVIERTDDGYQLVYRRLGPRDSTVAVAAHHARLLAREGLVATVVPDLAREVAFDGSTALPPALLPASTPAPEAPRAAEAPVAADSPRQASPISPPSSPAPAGGGVEPALADASVPDAEPDEEALDTGAGDEADRDALAPVDGHDDAVAAPSAVAAADEDEGAAPDLDEALASLHIDRAPGDVTASDGGSKLAAPPEAPAAPLGALPAGFADKLEARVEATVKAARGAGRVAGDERTAWMVWDLHADAPLVTINAEVPLQAASMIKPYVAVAVFHQAERGKLTVGPVTTEKLERMIRYSDNDATNWLLERVGGPSACQKLLTKHYPAFGRGLELVEYIPAGGRTYRNLATAEAHTALLRATWQDKVPRAAELRRILNLPGKDRLYHDVASIPSGTEVYNKTGTTARCVGDMGILVARTAGGARLPYILVGVIDKSARCSSFTSWARVRSDVIRSVSGAVYEGLKAGYGLA
jgi:beta-lactamase class A